MKHNKTICFFNSAKAWGGGEKWHLDIAYLLSQKDFKVVLAVLKNTLWESKIQSKHIPYKKFSISNLSFLNLFKIFQIVSFLKTNNVETIIINLSRDLKVAGFASKIAGVENIVYRRGSAIPIKNTFLNRFIFKHIVTNILANSEKTKQTINQNNPNLFPKDKIDVVYNGMDIDTFNNQGVNKIYQSSENEIVIGNIGRIVEQKAQDKLIELALQLKKENLKFKLIIGGEGPLLEELKQQAKTLKVDKNILFTGFVNDVKSFMESLDIFILTSKWEGFGYVIVEAMACKKPVLAFDISSNPEIIDHNNTGYLVKPFDINELKEKVLLIANTKEKREQLGTQAYRRATTKFSIDKTIHDLLSLDFINDCKKEL